MYKSAGGSEISLNAMNVPQGSVKVTAGGILLTENVDYTVDYTLGRVKILNEGILNSGTPIQISLENNSLFNIQTKTLMGTHIDQVVNKDLTLGATILNLTEKPITQKVNYGDEPISNTIWGFNGSYQKESPFITKMLNMLPFYSSKVPSKVAITGEFADLIPGHARAIGKTGTSYIDDFEGSISTIDLKNVGSWHIASTPLGQTNTGMFPEGKVGTGLVFRYLFVTPYVFFYARWVFGRWVAHGSHRLAPGRPRRGDGSVVRTRCARRNLVFCPTPPLPSRTAIARGAHDGPHTRPLPGGQAPRDVGAARFALRPSLLPRHAQARGCSRREDAGAASLSGGRWARSCASSTAER